MDASASTRPEVENHDVYGFFLKIENTEFPTPVKQKSTIIKYTKLPEFDFESKGKVCKECKKLTINLKVNPQEFNHEKIIEPWPHQSYTLQPRLRRIMTVEDPKSVSTRSLKPEVLTPSRPNISKRKIVTISEDDEYGLHHIFSKDTKRTSSVKSSNRSVGTDRKESKEATQKITSRSSSRFSRETKPSAKLNNDGKEPKLKSYNRSKSTNINQVSVENTKPRNIKLKDSVKTSKSVNASRTSVSKNYITPSESENEVSIIKMKLYDNFKNTPKKPVEKAKVPKTPPFAKGKSTFLKELQNKHKPIHVIHVPLDEKYRKSVVTPTTNNSTRLPLDEKYRTKDSPTRPTKIDLVKSDYATVTEAVSYRDMNISTDPPPEKVDSVTEMDTYNEPQIIYKCMHTTDVHTELIKETYDSLEIPNVTLTKNESSKERSHLHSASLPNLQAPPFKVMLDDESADSYHKSTSFIISRATLTYTTKQKINLHVVGSSDDAYSNQSPSPLSYPINVVSVYKKEMQGSDYSNDIKDRQKTNMQYKNCINDIKSRDCSYVANSDKLMKPSDIISTIRVNDSLFRSEYISEQFQRELNFIDSFFESLQYLESCSLSEKCFKDDQIEALVHHPGLLESNFEAKSLEYDRFFSKLENSANTNDLQTMASKDLFLLNILIRDEQRRAKNLLFVLKRREDALKDFTKSQIIYLESKKKQENTDISALKKKQRGALLKLQHECGEMQRMRKALLTLSDKRKVTLMKTKKDLELKLNNNVDNIILSKKKPKRNVSLERSSPLKCFELSSSACEESSTSASRRNSVDTLSSPERVHTTKPVVTSAEKSIQTGESILGTATTVDHATTTLDDNFIIVDGGYLNILFHNLSLPQIFSGGKQYEVNEDALKNIVDSSNSHINETRAIETLMEQIKNRDSDKSSSPSTARSLVEEFDQYYRGLDDRESPVESHYRSCVTACELSDATVQAEALLIDSRSFKNTSTMTIDSNATIVNSDAEVDDIEPCVCEIKEDDCDEEPAVSPVTGPLPKPAGAAAVLDNTPTTEAPFWPLAKSSSNTTFSESSGVSSSSLCELVSSVTSLTAPAQCEAEELRRQQLAIEKEIKELEQQQCRLLVVREIPDKPPPPYTPPAEPRVRTLRQFHTDDVTVERIQMYITEEVIDPCDPNDDFDVFVNDFCHEALSRTKQDRSEHPWDACNVLLPKSEPDPFTLVKTATAELEDVLAGVKPTVVSGVSSKRSDQIDDILFTEWRRVEPEWTSLHTDEAIVKNQIFESIFQRILTATVDEYKRTVLCEPVSD